MDPYLEKAIDNLTIDPANRLQRKVEMLTIEKSRLDRIEKEKDEDIKKELRKGNFVEIIEDG